MSRFPRHLSRVVGSPYPPGCTCSSLHGPDDRFPVLWLARPVRLPRLPEVPRYLRLARLRFPTLCLQQLLQALATQFLGLRSGHRFWVYPNMPLPLFPIPGRVMYTPRPRIGRGVCMFFGLHRQIVVV